MTGGSATDSPLAATTQTTGEDLLAVLLKLLPAQFDEVLLRAELPVEYLSAIGSPQATRAVEVIRYLAQRGRLAELARAIERVATRPGSSTAGRVAPSRRTRSRRGAQGARAAGPLVVAAATGAAALALLALMMSNAQALVRFGLIGHAWCALLALLGLFAAVMVFALFKSYARYRGQALVGRVELGGPVVVMLAVVALGFELVPAPRQRFDVTVFLHGAAGRHALVLRNHGKVALDLGADRRSEAVGDKGEVRFAGIPGELRGREVVLSLDDDTYELATPELALRLDHEAVYASVRPRQLQLVGYVADRLGRPLPRVRAAIASAAAVTDQGGRFEIALPADLPEGDRAITLTADGYAPWGGQAVPGGDPLRVRLAPSLDGW